MQEPTLPTKEEEIEVKPESSSAAIQRILLTKEKLAEIDIDYILK